MNTSGYVMVTPIKNPRYLVAIYSKYLFKCVQFNDDNDENKTKNSPFLL